MHPLALSDTRSGANGMSAGDRIVYIVDGRCGVVDEFMHDGEAFVSFDDGTLATVKWCHLRPEVRS